MVTMASGEIIGKRLREMRKEKGKTILEVSDETGIGATALGNYENGIRIPRDRAKMVLAQYFGKSVDEIFFSV